MWTSEKKSNPALEGPSSTSFFAPGFRMIGDIESVNDVRIEGIVQGNITTTKKIIIGKTGQIIGNVKANQISVMGEVVGEIMASDIAIIGESGIVHGTIVCNKVKIETGAEIEACIKKLKSQPEKELNNHSQPKRNEKKSDVNASDLKLITA
ncbi:MAG: polymer-forming cytoskeletal protein [Cyclobacteriaceae bacterium]